MTCARPPCLTSTGCVANVASECVLTAIGSAGTGQERVRHDFDTVNLFDFIFFITIRDVLRLGTCQYVSCLQYVSLRCR